MNMKGHKALLLISVCAISYSLRQLISGCTKICSYPGYIDFFW